MTLDKQLKEGKIFPLYYFYGPEEYLKREAIKKIKEGLIPPASQDFNYKLYYGKEASALEIINNAQTFPFLFPKKLLLIKEADQFSPSQWEEFLNYFNHPSPFSYLVFQAEKLNMEEKVLNLFHIQGEVVYFSHLPSSQLPYWIRRIAEGLDKEIDSEEIDFLIEMVGNNLQELYNELSKVALYLGEKRIIEIKDLEKTITPIKISSIFELVNSIGHKERKKSLKILKELLESGEHPLKILALISRQFRLIWKAKELMEKGVPLPEIRKELKIPPFFLSELADQVKQFSSEELRGGFFQLFKTDLALKSSRLKGRLILEKLTLELCQNRDFSLPPSGY